MAIFPTGVNPAFDAAALAAEQTKQSAIAQALATFQAGGTSIAYQLAVDAAEKAYLVAIQAAGAANAVSTPDELTALDVIATDPNPTPS